MRAWLIVILAAILSGIAYAAHELEVRTARGTPGADATQVTEVSGSGTGGRESILGESEPSQAGQTSETTDSGEADGDGSRVSLLEQDGDGDEGAAAPAGTDVPSAGTPGADDQTADDADAGRPTFDVVSVDPDGTAVFAGRAAPGASVTVEIGGEEVGTAEATERGEWVIIPDQPLVGGSVTLELEATPAEGGEAVQSNQQVTVIVPEDGVSETVIAGIEPQSEPAPAPPPAGGGASAGAPDVAVAPPSMPDAAQQAAPATPPAAPSTPGANAPAVAAAPQATPGTTTTPPSGASAPAVAAAPPATPGTAGQTSPGTATTPPPNAGAGAPAVAAVPPATPGTAAQTAPRATTTPPSGAGIGTAAGAGAPPAAPAPTAPAPALAGQPPAATAPATPPAAPPATSSETIVVLSEPGQPTRVLQGAASPAESNGGGASAPLAFDTVDYDDKGDIIIAGQGEAGADVRAYIDNQLIGDTRADSQGRWTLRATRDIAPGEYELRVDRINQEGLVVARAAAPFERARQQFTLDAQGRAEVMIRPGDNLWNIARAIYGSGVQYTVIYSANTNQIIDPDLIYPGQVLLTPGAAAPAADQTGTPG